MKEDPASPWHGASSISWARPPASATWKPSTRATISASACSTSLAVLGVLLVVLRRALVSLYLVLTVLLGFFVSIGVTKLLFMWISAPPFTAWIGRCRCTCS